MSGKIRTTGAKGAALLTLLCVLGRPATAREQPVKTALTLASAVASARERNPLARAARLEASAANLDVKKALYRKYLPAPEFRLDAGLVPGAQGDIFYSPDKQTDLDNLGLFYRFDFSLVQPLYTFGGASSAVEAARRLADVEQARSGRTLEDLSLEVVKAYWGVQAARKAETLARQSAESYDRLIAEIEKRLAREDSEVDDQDLLEARSHLIDIELIRQESLQNKEAAESSLRMLLDLDPDTDLAVSDEAPPEFQAEANVPPGLAGLAERLRPEIRGLSAAIRALEAKISYSRSRRLPTFYLAAGLGYARAANRQDQKNPFAVDNFNYRNLGAALGMRWDPAFWVHDVEVEKASEEQRVLLEKLRAQQAAAGLEAGLAYIEVRKNDALLRAARGSLEAARSWMMVSQDNWDMGLGEPFRLLRAYQAYFALKGAEIERENAFNVSAAKLAHAIGPLDLYLRWVGEGKVSLE